MPTGEDLRRDWGPALVLAAGGGLAREVTSVVVTDRVHRIAPGPGDLLVAVGFAEDEVPDLVAAAKAAGASAVLVKGVSLPTLSVDDPAVLVVDPAADWGHLVSLARVSLAAGPVLGAAQDESLFALADALAALCGGSVVIHDASWHLLAHSSGEAHDEVRTATLLGRRAPVEAVDELRSMGVVDRLQKGELVHLADDELPGMTERWAAGVLVGGQLLGTIWVTPTAGTQEQQALDGLRRAVDVAALALLRQAALGHGPSNDREVPFDALLAGARTERLVAQRLGVAVDGGFVLAGLRPVASDRIERAATARRLVALARSYAEAYRVTALVGVVGDAVFVLFPSADDAERSAAVRVLTDLHTRLQRTAPHRAMVSSRFASLTEVGVVRSTVEELLDFAERRGWSGLTDTHAIQASWRLEQFRELALAHPALLEGPGARLLEHDRATGAELMPTLRAWFQHVGDARAVADSLGLHVNTVRNRIRRIHEVVGINLDDPDERLLIELQVRLLTD